ncbi:hypothetical protein ACHAP5_002914 [Fusarium lateritium]
MVNISSIEYTPLVLKGFCALCTYIGGAHIVRGIRIYLPPAELVKLPSDSISMLDTNYRFLGAIFMGYGVMFGWTAYDIKARQLPLNILLAIGALGGIGRMISGATYGWGGSFARNAAIREVVFPALVYWFGSRHYV